MDYCYRTATTADSCPSGIPVRPGHVEYLLRRKADVVSEALSNFLRPAISARIRVDRAIEAGRVPPQTYAEVILAKASLVEFARSCLDPHDFEHMPLPVVQPSMSGVELGRGWLSMRLLRRRIDLSLFCKRDKTADLVGRHSRSGVAKSRN